MRKALLIASVLFIAVISTACINNIAVQELNNKAAEYMQKGDYDSAVNRLQASIDLDSTVYETYYNLGIAATKAKKYPIAIDAFENGLKLNPEHVDFYLALATAQLEYIESIQENTEATEEDKNKIPDLKNSAKNNLQEYLAKNPQAEDKKDLEEILSEIDLDNTNKENSETKLLKG